MPRSVACVGWRLKRSSRISVAICLNAPSPDPGAGPFDAVFPPSPDHPSIVIAAIVTALLSHTPRIVMIAILSCAPLSVRDAPAGGHGGIIPSPMHHSATALSCLLVTLGVFVTAQPKGDSAIDRLITQMTLEEKIAMLHGATDPERFGQAGYLPGVPRLGIPPLRLSDGPAGVRTAQPATALPAPVALAASFSRRLAGDYGAVLGRESQARGQDVLFGPMVNLVRVPLAGRNFETLGEDPFLQRALIAPEV